MAKKDFNVLLLHGHGREWTVVQKYIENEGYRVRVLTKIPGGGVLFEKFRDMVWDKAHCAVVVMTKDDKVLMRGTAAHRARQNVVFELGYCFGAFDSLDPRAKYKAEDAVIVVEEKGVQRFANIEGLVTIQFASGKIDAATDDIGKALKRAYKRGRQFYGL